LIEVRLATLNDIEGIVEVHCSDIDKWYRDIHCEKIETDYKDLTIIERFLHGGPWMTVETCKEHLKNLLENNQYPLIAIDNGKIIGELELYIGYERGIGETAYIDILEVHKKHRGKGVGRQLISEAYKYAEEKKCRIITVWPTKDALEFYKKTRDRQRVI
jgi:GNAT superfamily N-acetyltransferase